MKPRGLNCKEQLIDLDDHQGNEYGLVPYRFNPSRMRFEYYSTEANEWLFDKIVNMYLINKMVDVNEGFTE